MHRQAETSWNGLKPPEMVTLFSGRNATSENKQYVCAPVLNTTSVCQHARGWDVWQSKPENIVGRHNTRHLHVQHKGSKPRKIPACCVHVHISGRFSAPSFNQKPQHQQHFLTVTVFVWRAKERSQHQKRPNFIAQLPSLLPSSRYIFIKMNVRI